MKLIHHINELRTWREANPHVALVPTMGNLHEGHLHLVNLARQHAEHVAVSIFVNPLQFGPTEDFTRYPRTLEQDADKLRECGVDLLFAPDVSQILPATPRCQIALPALANQLCGATRPGHFVGVATIVLKLFNLVQPDIACFGKKDYQQLGIIRMMVEDFNVPIEIIAGETQRAADGLALSSRNQYLTPDERARAPQLFQQLQLITHLAQQADANVSQLEQNAWQTLAEAGWQPDYIQIRNRYLAEPTPQDQQLVVVGAARLGNTRLIDNLEFSRQPA